MNSHQSSVRAENTTQSFRGIRWRLIYGFSAIMVIFIVSTLTTMHYMRAAMDHADKFLNNSMPSIHSIVDLQSRLTELEVDVEKISVFQDKSKIQEIKLLLPQIIDLIDLASKEIPLLGSDLVSEKWLVVKNTAQLYLLKVDSLIKASNVVQDAALLAMYRNDLLPVSDKLSEGFNIERSAENKDGGLFDVMDDMLRSNMSLMHDNFQFINVISFSFLIGTMILTIFIAFFTIRSIINPVTYAMRIAQGIAGGGRDIDINIDSDDEAGQLLKSLALMRDSIKGAEEKIRKTAEENKKLYESVVKSASLFSQHSSRVAVGDLTKRLELNGDSASQDVMSQLGRDLNLMTDNLSGVTNNIMQACTSMVSTLDEVRHTVDSQSSGASEQASSINEITASITEIEKSATQTLNKARDLGGVAEKTRQSGQLGLESIETSVMGMKSVRDKVQLIAQTILDLSRQTQQVGEITSVVNNLAQQSKMLALNASIEAAKAGDAGKGFAVVASEVKNLAEQSEQSTAQVQKILEDIKIATEKAVMVTEEGTKGVDSGLLMIERTGEIIRDLNDVIREASIASQQIEAAVRQEGAGIEQITLGMNEINIVTSSFVESVRQTTVAMDDLAGVTSKLKSSVDAYKL